MGVENVCIEEAWFTRDLVCPRDHLQLETIKAGLICSKGHRYPVVEGIPIMLIDEVPQTMEMFKRSIGLTQDAGIGADSLYLDTVGLSYEQEREVRSIAASGTSPVDPVASFLIAATNGMAYRHLVGKLSEYPIPELRMPQGEGKTLLDIGCNWGRWSIAAARLGYRPIGLDPCLGAVAAARRVSKQLGVEVRSELAPEKRIS